MGGSDDHEDNFEFSGPKHMIAKIGGTSSPKKMTEIDWDNQEQRRCIVACLVKGVYVLESDHAMMSRGRSFPLAPPWWESFHFRQLNVLDHACKCVHCKIVRPKRWFAYGAVFEYVPPDGACRHPSAPRYIVAFRGTMPGHPTMFGDMRLNLRILLNMQQRCARFKEAGAHVGDVLEMNSISNPASAVWLAGHSLGASIALEVGRDMMLKNGYNLPTFLFNPPHVSLLPVVNMLGVTEQAKRDVHINSYSLKHAIGTTILKRQKKHMEAVFERLSPWVPELYVNQGDIICNGFIDHFELRQKTQERFPRIAKSAATLAYRDMLHLSAMSNLFGDKIKARQHLLPSARLWKNESSYGKTHELKQWWKPEGPELKLSPKRYNWP